MHSFLGAVRRARGCFKVAVGQFFPSGEGCSACCLPRVIPFFAPHDLAFFHLLLKVALVWRLLIAFHFSTFQTVWTGLVGVAHRVNVVACLCLLLVCVVGSVATIATRLYLFWHFLYVIIVFFSSRNHLLRLLAVLYVLHR